MKNAYNYIRWSTLEQGNEDRSSEYRQDRLTQGHCSSKGYAIAERLVDSGLSAYTGANLETGQLGKLTKRFLSGALDPRESVLVVEELDRLSRRPPADMLAWITPLLAAGLTIEVAKCGTVLTQERMNQDMGTFMMVIMKAFQAYQFGETQKTRGSMAWNKWREKAASGEQLSKRGKGRKWLEWDAATSQWLAIPERVALIEEMFQLRLQGVGKSTIGKLFNKRAADGDEHYRVWESNIKGKQRKKPVMWTTSAIARIVQDPAVTGYIQCNKSPRGKSKVPIGEPVKVYPAVISEELFAKANTERLTNQLKHQGKNRNVSNLIGPVGRCKACGSVMAARGSAVKIHRKDGTVSQHYFIYCANAKSNGGCTNQRGWSYLKMESALLDRLLTLAIDDQHFGADDAVVNQLQGNLASLERRLRDRKAGAARILNIIASDETDDMALTQYGELKAKIASDQKAVDEAKAALSSAKGAVSPAEHLVRVADVREQMDSDDFEKRYEARSLVRQAFADLIRIASFDPESGTVTVKLVSGLGAMFIFNDYSTSYLDLAKPHKNPTQGLDSDQAEVVTAFLRRRDEGLPDVADGIGQLGIQDIVNAMAG